MGHLLGLQTRVSAPSPTLRERVKDVVVIASSSRGGSSLLAEILRRIPGLLHFHGEVNPFFVLAGLAFPASRTGSDRLDASHLALEPQVRALDQLLLEDCGVPVDDLTAPDLRSRFLQRLLWRLAAQWPGLDVRPDELEKALDCALPTTTPADSSSLHLRILLALRPRYPDINPYYYDIARDRVREADPAIPFPDGPHSGRIVEEPPFITPPPTRPPSPEELEHHPLVIKTPSNAYRLPFLAGFFPRARFRVLHLTRNAAASINGLFDGWRHLGFFSHPFPGRLAIPGYSDVCGPWAADWWKFDLPPGWEAFTHRPLTEVCAFQWRSAHEATLDFLEHRPVDSHRLAFEQLLEPRTRTDALKSLAQWLGVPLEAPAATEVFSQLPVIMATDHPRNHRWLERAEMLEPVLASPPLRDTMRRLGYDDVPDTWL